MPIVGRTLPEAARSFCKHLNDLLARTVTQARLREFGARGAPTINITFRQAGIVREAPLNTHYGPMGLYIGQLCGSVPTQDGRHRLITVQYKYTLTPAGANEPLFRWEYIRRPKAGANWCRNHLQGAPMVYLGEQTVPLNRWHLPTGYVPIEDILRFCIMDLRVKPLSTKWDRVLRESYQRFRTEFVQEGAVAPQ